MILVRQSLVTIWAVGGVKACSQPPLFPYSVRITPRACGSNPIEHEAHTIGRGDEEGA